MVAPGLLSALLLLLPTGSLGLRACDVPLPANDTRFQALSWNGESHTEGPLCRSDFYPQQYKGEIKDVSLVLSILLSLTPGLTYCQSSVSHSLRFASASMAAGLPSVSVALHSFLQDLASNDTSVALDVLNLVEQLLSYEASLHKAWRPLCVYAACVDKGCRPLLTLSFRIQETVEVKNADGLLSGAWKAFWADPVVDRLPFPSTPVPDLPVGHILFSATARPPLVPMPDVSSFGFDDADLGPELPLEEDPAYCPKA